MENWLNFEHLVAHIYRSISPAALVKHNDKIRGHETQTERQIDVSIRFRESGCDFLVIVQAKTDKRPLDVNAIGEFAGVIKDVRATKGVLICNSGFTKTAQTYAHSLGVDLCSAHDAEARDWKMLLKLPVFWLRLTTNLRCELTLELMADDFVSAEFPNWRFSTDAGATEFSLWELFKKRWNLNLIPTTSGKDHVFEIGTEILHFSACGLWRRVCDIKLTYRIERLLLRNEVETEDFTGIRNFLTDKLEVARLGVSLPPRLREFGWTEIDPDDEKLMVVKNAVVTVEAPPAIQYELDDPVNTSVMHDNADICDPTTGRIRIRRPCIGNVVFQTVDPHSREISFTEILSW